MTTDNGPEKPKQKKSETLEVRIPFETKQLFLTACREDGTTASEVVRSKVQDYLDERARPSQPVERRSIIMKFPAPVRRYGVRIAAGSVLAVGMATMAALPSAAAPDFKAQFSRLDKNGDGILSVDEFIGSKGGDDVHQARTINIQTLSSTSSASGDGAAKPTITISPNIVADLKQDSFSLWLPEELGGGKAGEEKEQRFEFITRAEKRSGQADGADAPPPELSSTIVFTVEDVRKRQFASIDANGDGKVSLQEYQSNQTAQLTRGFEILDVSGDKFLSEDEYAKIVAGPPIQLSFKGVAGAPEIPKIEIPGLKTYTPEQIKAAFTGLDANKDGKLSLQEYLPTT